MLLPADTPNVSFFSFLEGFGYNDDCCKKYVSYVLLSGLSGLGFVELFPNFFMQ